MDGDTEEDRPGTSDGGRADDLQASTSGNAQAKSSKSYHTYTVSLKLKAVEFAKANSNESAARKFGVDAKRIREWRCKEHVLRKTDGTSKRLKGGGRKPFDYSFDDELVQWIIQMRERRLCVSRKMLMKKAAELFATEYQQKHPSKSFVASIGWLNKFLSRNHISLRRKTTVGQKLPNDVAPKLVSFIAYVKSLRIQRKYDFDSIYAMDETAIWLDMPSATTLETKGSKEVPIRTTGHEKSRITVCLTAKASGKKLKPLIVLKGKRLDKSLAGVRGAVIELSANGWMTEELTLKYVRQQIGTLSFSRRLLVWDSYRCHISKTVKEEMNKLSIDKAIIPGGCTGLIQAADVSWNKPFKDKYRELYENWMQNGEKTFTKSGNMRSPTRLDVVNWVIESWASLSEDIIVSSFKTCAITNALDGSEDELIGVLKNGKICSDKLEEVKDIGRKLVENGGDFKALQLDGGYNEDGIAGEEAGDNNEDFFENELVVEDDDNTPDETLPDTD